MPPSMQASEDPMAEHPTASPDSGAFQMSARIWTQRRSSSAVWGYSSLSMRFLSMQRSISLWISGSSHVWQNVARFWRALPSSSSSSAIPWYASAGSISAEGQDFDGSVAMRSRLAKIESSISSRTLSLLCKGMGAPPVGSVQRFAHRTGPQGRKRPSRSVRERGSGAAASRS